MSDNYRVRFEYDPDAHFEESNGERRPLTASEYIGNEYMHPDHTPIPYDEYRRYYGNPERHVYLMCVVEKQCSCCQRWSVANSLGYIDVMDDDPVLARLPLGKPLTPDAVLTMGGYLTDIARDCLDDAGYAVPQLEKGA